MILMITIPCLAICENREGIGEILIMLGLENHPGKTISLILIMTVMQIIEMAKVEDVPHRTAEIVMTGSLIDGLVTEGGDALTTERQNIGATHQLTPGIESQERTL